MSALLSWIPFLSILFTRRQPRSVFSLYELTLGLIARSIAYNDALVRRAPQFKPNLLRGAWGLVLGILDHGATQRTRWSIGWKQCWH